MSAPDVALISPYPSLAGSHHAGTSGVASYTANLARALRDRGTGVHVVAPADEGVERTEADGDGITIERCIRPGFRGLHDAVIAARRTMAPVAHLQFELFLYGGPATLAGVVPALARLRRSGTEAVVTLHQTVEPGSVDRSYTALHRVGVPAPVARIGIGSLQRGLSAAASATLVHEEPFREVVPSATVIPHGVERMPTVERRRARSRLGLDDRFVALCFGFLAPYKGLEVALTGAALAGPSVQCVVAGGEHPRLAGSGDRYASELRRRHPHARFTGWVDGEDVSDWFHAADVALFPYPRPFSSSGALSIALACGTPVLLSAPMARCIGAPSPLVIRDAGDLATRLRRLSVDADERHELRRWTDRLVEGRHWDEVADLHRDLYRSVAA